MKKEYNTVEEIQQRIKHLNRNITKLQLEKDSLLIKRNKLCDCSTKEHKSTYTSGSYLETGYTDNWDECIICHKKYNVVQKSTGFYN
jgi:hypothetical protein